MRSSGVSASSLSPAAWLAALLPSLVPNQPLQPKGGGPPTVAATVLAEYPHDPYAFTQGLHYEPRTQTLLESTGLYGGSTCRRVDIKSGKVLACEHLEPDHFGEGLSVDGTTLLQLLWRVGLCLVRDATTLRCRRVLPLPIGMREGWGLTSDGAGAFWASDGSSTLHELDARSLEVRRTVQVRVGGRALPSINDLQWVDGILLANIWRQDRLAAIDPDTGEVRAFVDLSNLLPPGERRRLGPEEVLNGIAYDPSGGGAEDASEDGGGDMMGGCLYVTGKCWPKLFKVRLPRLVM